jgi:hypothetical protein|tara:strand:- start:842 stop:1504 length:663 start_codon:yes stop_codon:yes gene_type:complete
MLWPTLCIDNFFPNLNEVIKFAKSLPYKPSEDGRWPGERSEILNKVSMDFFNYSTSKMIAALYPGDWRNMSWDAHSVFQKVSGMWQGEGWVHQDPLEISCLVYLETDENCGTSLFKQITHESICSEGQTEKRKGYLSPNMLEDKRSKEALRKNNERFKKTASFDAVPNRLVLFDQSQFHGVNNFNNSTDAERLTLVTFFGSVRRNDGQQLKYHAVEAQRV